MTKLKYIFCLFFLILICLTGCGKQITLADHNLSESKILFTFVEYNYYEESDSYFVMMSAICNNGEHKILNMDIDSSSEIIQYIEDPNAILLFLENMEEDLYTFNTIDVETLHKYYKKTFNIENKTIFDYNLLYGDNEGEYKNILYGYSYINSEDYVPTKYYQINNAIISIKDDIGCEIMDYLASIFS